MEMRTWFSCSIATLSLLNSHALAEDPLLRQRFLNEAPDHWKQIAEAMDKVECWLKGKSTKRDEAGRSDTHSCHYKIRKNGNLLLLEIHTLDELDKSLDPLKGRVTGVNSRYAFHLTQREPSQSWLVGVVGAEYRDRLSLEIRVGIEGIVNPYTFLTGDVSLLHIFQDPGFECLSVDPVEREGKLAAKVMFRYAATIPKPTYLSDALNDLRGGWFILSPDDHWSVQEYNISFAGPIIKESGFNEYGEVVDGYRIPRRSKATIVKKGKQGEVITYTDTIDYERFVRTELPEEAFSLSAYGLPEPIAETSKKTKRLYLAALLFGLAALGILISFILRRRSRRALQEKPTTSGNEPDGDID